MADLNEACFEGVHCTIKVARPHPTIVVVTFEGQDTGELGDAPFWEIEKDFVKHPKIELFIDARLGKAASVDVSSEWARWLAAKRAHLLHISMLTGSRFLQMTAGFVRKFADLGDLMRLYTDASVFEGALGNSVANARART
jgi:hypothetical protein